MISVFFFVFFSCNSNVLLLQRTMFAKYAHRSRIQTITSIYVIYRLPFAVVGSGPIESIPTLHASFSTIGCNTGAAVFIVLLRWQWGHSSTFKVSRRLDYDNQFLDTTVYCTFKVKCDLAHGLPKYLTYCVVFFLQGFHWKQSANSGKHLVCVTGTTQSSIIVFVELLND